MGALHPCNRDIAKGSEATAKRICQVQRWLTGRHATSRHVTWAALQLSPQLCGHSSWRVTRGKEPRCARKVTCRSRSGDAATPRAAILRDRLKGGGVGGAPRNPRGLQTPIY
ncbi:Hypothetical predicted protein [Pelobates cultripes]|uniref:Uncharacterized protein n=1 Tax=Pelobates cultripes TaxID=61616 RepID=A0AAD1TJ67_PELCU|nr:Hypothetical predicted protein [Pelobates cultripes]